MAGIKLELLGGGQEVGRSSVLLEANNYRLLMDYGLEIDKEPEWPLPAGRVDAVIASHAHLDHIGSLPILYKDASPPLYCNDCTLDTTMLLLEDAMKVAGHEKYRLPFGIKEVKAVAAAGHIIADRKKFNIGPFDATFLPAGHIPGSVGILLEFTNKNGDVNILTSGASNCTTRGKASAHIITNEVSNSKMACKTGDILTNEVSNSKSEGKTKPEDKITNFKLTGKDSVSIFYTGNFKLEETRLLPKIELPKNVDILITEATYGTREHPPRIEQEKALIEAVEEGIAKGETVLLPVFAVGRAQEILMILEKYSEQIALDGMAKAAAELTMRYPQYIKNPQKMREILDNVTWIRKDKERAKVVGKFPIIVTTAGMMGGGPILYYLHRLRKQKDAKVLFCGFLAEDSPARILLETGTLRTAETEFEVRCDIRQFDLSAHAGRREIFELIKRTNPERIIALHGPDCKGFTSDVEEHFGIKTYAPKNGEVCAIF